MTPLPERGLLAIAAVLDVALNARTAPVPARGVAERLGLAPRRLEPLLQDLVRDGVLKGTRGPRGGYALARERRRITVADILRVAEPETDQDRPVLVETAVLPALTEPAQAFLSALERLTLHDLCQRAEQAGAAPEQASDFAI